MARRPHARPGAIAEPRPEKDDPSDGKPTPGRCLSSTRKQTILPVTEASESSARQANAENGTLDGKIHPGRAFSLLELVIVVVIIAVIAAIAIPRLSRGSSGAADAALRRDLMELRKAIDLFILEHNGKIPTRAEITAALTKYSDASGTGFADARDADHIYGPYLRAIPGLPVGKKKGCAGIAAGNLNGVGWIYNDFDGSIRANTSTEADDSGKLYRDY